MTFGGTKVVGLSKCYVLLFSFKDELMGFKLKMFLDVSAKLIGWQSWALSCARFERKVWHPLNGFFKKGISKFHSCSQTVWPDVGIKVAHIFQKLPKRKPQQFIITKWWCISKYPQKSSNIWGTFVRFFISKTLKIANLVTLQPKYFAKRLVCLTGLSGYKRYYIMW